MTEEQEKPIEKEEMKNEKVKSIKKGIKTHVSDAKKRKVEELKNLMKKKAIIIASIKSLPSSQFQDIRKKLRSKADVVVAKKSLIDFALEHSKDAHLKELIKYVDENCALLFSDEDAFELSATLSENKSPAKAKPGQEATEDIHIEAGPTELIPGPDISFLSGVGLQVKIENGKIAIQAPKLLIKKGDPISAAQSAVLAKLDITPFEVGLEPMVAFYNGKVYKDIKIDKLETLEQLKQACGRGVAFAVSIDQVNLETLPFILAKAGSHENAISSLIKQDAPKEETKVEEKPAVEEEKKEETATKEPTAEEEKPAEVKEKNKSDSN